MVKVCKTSKTKAEIVATRGGDRWRTEREREGKRYEDRARGWDPATHQHPRPAYRFEIANGSDGFSVDPSRQVLSLEVVSGEILWGAPLGLVLGPLEKVEENGKVGTLKVKGKGRAKVKKWDFGEEQYKVPIWTSVDLVKIAVEDHQLFPETGREGSCWVVLHLATTEQRQPASTTITSETKKQEVWIYHWWTSCTNGVREWFGIIGTPSACGNLPAERTRL